MKKNNRASGLRARVQGAAGLAIAILLAQGCGEPPPRPKPVRLTVAEACQPHNKYKLGEFSGHLLTTGMMTCRFLSDKKNPQGPMKAQHCMARFTDNGSNWIDAIVPTSEKGQPNTMQYPDLVIRAEDGQPIGNATVTIVAQIEIQSSCFLDVRAIRRKTP